MALSLLCSYKLISINKPKTFKLFLTIEDFTMFLVHSICNQTFQISIIITLNPFNIEFMKARTQNHSTYEFDDSFSMSFTNLKI